MMENNKFRKIVDWISNIDRKVVYLFMFFAISLPFFLKPVISIKSTPWVKSAYDLIEEAAQKNKPIMIGFDYDPSTLAELQPMAKSLLRHAFSRNVKVVGLNFLPQGTTRRVQAARAQGEVGDAHASHRNARHDGGRGRAGGEPGDAVAS